MPQLVVLAFFCYRALITFASMLQFRNCNEMHSTRDHRVLRKAINKYTGAANGLPAIFSNNFVADIRTPLGCVDQLRGRFYSCSVGRALNQFKSSKRRARKSVNFPGFQSNLCYFVHLHTAYICRPFILSKKQQFFWFAFCHVSLLHWLRPSEILPGNRV